MPVSTSKQTGPPNAAGPKGAQTQGPTKRPKRPKPNGSRTTTRTQTLTHATARKRTHPTLASSKNIPRYESRPFINPLTHEKEKKPTKPRSKETRKHIKQDIHQLKEKNKTECINPGRHTPGPTAQARRTPKNNPKAVNHGPDKNPHTTPDHPTEPYSAGQHGNPPTKKRKPTPAPTTQATRATKAGRNSQ